MNKAIVDIFEEFLDSIVLDQLILSSVIDFGNTNIELRYLYHLREGMFINIDGSDYKVISISGNIVTVQGEILNPGAAIIPNPFYFHGTPFATNNLISGANDDQKFPMNYLYEIIKEEKIYEDDSLTDRKARLRWFILDSSNGEFTTDEHYDIVINGIREYYDYVEQKIVEYPDFRGELIEKFEIYSHANFGKFLELQGYKSHIFDEITSGLEIRFDLLISKNLGCE